MSDGGQSEILSEQERQRAAKNRVSWTEDAGRFDWTTTLESPRKLLSHAFDFAMTASHEPGRESFVSEFNMTIARQDSQRVSGVGVKM